MTENIKIKENPSQKEIIYDYIDVIGISKSSVGKYIKKDFILEFIDLLKCYKEEADISKNPRYSDEDLQCFIDTAHIKYNNQHLINIFLETAAGTIAGTLYGLIASKILSDEVNVFPKIGALIGFFAMFKVSYSSVKQDVYYKEALECYCNIQQAEVLGISGIEDSLINQA